MSVDLSALTTRQAEALPLVLSAATLRAGLESANVHRATWHRWLAEPAFRAAVDGMRREALDEAMSDLRAGARFAVTSLLGLLASKNEHVRLSAARSVLEFMQRSAETEELQARLARIEEAVGAVARGEGT